MPSHVVSTSVRPAPSEIGLDALSNLRVFEWMVESGLLTCLPSLWSYRSSHVDLLFVERPRVHFDASCSPLAVPVSWDEVRVSRAVCCAECLSRAVPGFTGAVGDAVFFTFNAVGSLASAIDAEDLPLSDVYPALRAERVHLVVDRVREQSVRRLSTEAPRSETVRAQEVFRSRLDGLFADIDRLVPRGTRARVMREAARFCATEQTLLGSGCDSELFRSWLHRGKPPAADVSSLDRQVAAELAEHAKSRLVSARDLVVELVNMRPVGLKPLERFEEVAVAASRTHVSPHGGVSFGEMPDVVRDHCGTLFARSDRPCPLPLGNVLAPVSPEVLDMAAFLFAESNPQGEFGSLSKAVAAAVALG